ncbi:MAG: ATP-binding protein [Planctomycetes bacterium]|nr:ATP-binding protein [Planctomycetota bacterium]
MQATVVLHLTGPLDHLRLVWQAGETLLESVAFPDDPEGNRYNILLALQEMVTNVLRHAYQRDDAQPVEVRFAVTPERFAVTLRDRGPEFDPLQFVPDPACLAGDMPSACGGFGIQIAREVMDELTWRRNDGWNELTMGKLLAVPAAR